MGKAERFRLDRDAAGRALSALANPQPSQEQLDAFLRRLGQCRNFLSRSLIKTLRGQALAGDLTGAEKGLKKALKL